MSANGVKTDAESVWHETKNLRGVEAFEDPSIAKIGPLPSGTTPNVWNAVKMEEIVQRHSSDTPTKVGPVDDSARPLQITIRKNDTKNLYEPWINGFLVPATTTEAGEQVYMLPSFERAYKPVLQGGNTASCVTPVVISLLVEKNVRPPEYAEVSSRQQYIGPGGASDKLHREIVYQEDKLEAASRLYPTIATSSRGHSVATPYPCQFPKEPRVAVHDMTPFKAQNLKLLNGVVNVAFMAFVGFVFAAAFGMARIYGGTTDQAFEFVEMLRSGGVSIEEWYDWFVQYASIAKFINAFRDNWDLLYTSLVEYIESGGSNTEILTDVFNEYAGGLRSMFVQYTTLPTRKPARKVHFTLPQITEIVESIRPGGVNTSRTSRVLIDWMTSTSPSNKISWRVWPEISDILSRILSISTWFVSFLVTSAGNFAGQFFGVVPFPVNKRIETKEFTLNTIRGYTLRHDIVVSITDTHSCVTGVPRLVFRAHNNEALQAGLLHLGIDDDVTKLAASIEAAIDRLENGGVPMENVSVETAFGFKSGLSRLDWILSNVPVAPGTNAQQLRNALTAFLAGFRRVGKKNLVGGLRALRQNILDSTEVSKFLRDVLARREFHAFQAAYSFRNERIVVRTLPQPLNQSSIIKHVVKPPKDEEVLYTDVDDQDAPLVSRSDAKFTHVAAIRGVSSSFDATMAVLATLHDGAIRPLNRQCWRDANNFVKELSVTVQQRRNLCYITYSPFSFGFPSDVIVKISEDNLSSSNDDEFVTSWVTRRENTPSDSSRAYDPDPFDPSHQQAMLAFSDMIVDVQTTRATLPGSIAIQMSVLDIADRRLANMKELFESLVVAKEIYSSGKRSKKPFDNDIAFVAVPGGVDLFRLLTRLRFIRIIDVRSLERDETLIDELVQKKISEQNARAIVERSRQSQPLPLSLACREFVSRASFDSQSIRTRNALNNPYSMDRHVKNGMKAFQSALSAVKKGVPIPAMAMFVMREGAIELASQSTITSRTSETLASMEVARLFASLYEQKVGTIAFSISRSLSTAVALNRPVYSVATGFSYPSPPTDASAIERYTALRRNQGVVYGANGMETADILNVMRTRNAMYNVSLDGFLSNRNDVAAIGPRLAISAVEELTELFERQSVLHQPSDSMSVKIPFAAGENTTRPLIAPMSTTSTFDTSPILLDSLTKAIALIRPPRRQDSVLIGRISDRSPTLLQQGVSTTRPFEIDMKKNSDTAGAVASGAGVGIAVPSPVIITSIIMSQTIDYDTIMYNNPRPETIYGRNATVMKPDTVSEITWNAERIVQATMATMGAFAACTQYRNEPLNIEIEAPIGWVVSPNEANRLRGIVTTAERRLNIHRSTQEDLLRGVFAYMWDIIRDIRLSDRPIGVTTTTTVSSGTFGFASTLPMTADIGEFQFSADIPASAAPAGAAAAASAPTTAAPTASAPTAAAPTAGNNNIDPQTYADMSIRPRSLFPEAFTDANQTLVQLFDAMSDTDDTSDKLRDRIVNAFVKELHQEADKLIQSEPVRRFYKSKDGGNALRQQLIQNYKEGVSKLRSWKTNLQKLQRGVADATLQRQRWCAQVSSQTTSSNESGARRLSSAVLLAQAILIQLMGNDSAPQMKLVPKSTANTVGECIQRPADVGSAITAVSERLEAACNASALQGYAWMTLGELVHIFSIDAGPSLPGWISAKGTALKSPAPDEFFLSSPYLPPGAPRPDYRGMQIFSRNHLTDRVVQTGFALREAFFNGTIQPVTQPYASVLTANTLSELGVPDLALFVILLQTTYFSSPVYLNGGRNADVTQCKNALSDLENGELERAVEEAVLSGARDAYNVSAHCFSYAQGSDRLSILKRTLCNLLVDQGFKPRTEDGLNVFDYGDDSVQVLSIDIEAIRNIKKDDAEISEILSNLFSLSSRTTWNFVDRNGSLFAECTLPLPAERNSYRQQFGHLFNWCVSMKLLVPTATIAFILWMVRSKLLGGDPLEAPADVVSSFGFSPRFDETPGFPVAEIGGSGTGNAPFPTADESTISAVSSYAVALMPQGTPPNERSLEALNAFVALWTNTFNGDYTAFVNADTSTSTGLIQVAQQQTDAAVLGSFGANVLMVIRLATTGQLDLTGRILQNAWVAVEGGPPANTLPPLSFDPLGIDPDALGIIAVPRPVTNTTPQNNTRPVETPQNNTQMGESSSFWIIRIMWGIVLANGFGRG